MKSWFWIAQAYVFGGVVFRLTLEALLRQRGAVPPREFYRWIVVLLGELLMLLGWPYWLWEAGWRRKDERQRRYDDFESGRGR